MHLVTFDHCQKYNSAALHVVSSSATIPDGEQGHAGREKPRIIIRTDNKMAAEDSESPRVHMSGRCSEPLL